MSSAVIIPEKKDFLSYRAAFGTVAGVLLGSGLFFFGATSGILVPSLVAGVAGYFLGVVLVELVFWIAFSLLSAASVALLLLLVG